jgi:hypothetical protein
MSESRRLKADDPKAGLSLDSAASWLYGLASDLKGKPSRLTVVTGIRGQIKELRVEVPE